MDRDREDSVLWGSLLLVVAAATLCLGSGCTLGPIVKTEHVIVRPGNPMIVTENVEVTGQFVETKTDTKQDIGGWIAMPREHFEALKGAATGGAK
jgi:hypothetical protein